MVGMEFGKLMDEIIQAEEASRLPVEPEQLKHLAGQHDQDSHGNWALGMRGANTAAGKRLAFQEGMAGYDQEIKKIDAELKKLRDRRAELGAEFWQLGEGSRVHRQIIQLSKARKKLSKERQAHIDEGINHLVSDFPADLQRVSKWSWLADVDEDGDPDAEVTADFTNEMDPQDAYAIDASLKIAGQYITRDLLAEQYTAGADIGTIPVRVGITKRIRAYFSYSEGGALFVPGLSYAAEKYTPSMIWHELGHWMENHISGARERTLEFLTRRTAGEKEKLLKGTRNEYVKKDKFIHPYIGRIYKHGSTEVLSVGFELLMTEPYRLATKDPEMFDLVLSIIQGIPEK